MTHITDGLSSALTKLGNPAQDKIAALTYAAPSTSSTTEYVNAYRTSVWAKRVVDQPAEDCFRKGREWQAEADEITLLEATETRLKWRERMRTAKVYAAIYGRGHVYFDTGADPAEPFNPNEVKRGGLRFLTALSMLDVVDGIVDDDPMSETYGEPSYYEIMSTSGGSVQIHPSRMVTLYGSIRPDASVVGIQSDSVLLSVLPVLKQYEATAMGVAHLVQEAKVDVLTVPGLAELLSSPEGEEQFATFMSTIAAMKGNYGMMTLPTPASKDESASTYDQKKMSFATLPDVIESFENALSGAARIPRSLLFGTSAGGLGSTGQLELSAYYDYINTVQTNYIQPALFNLDEALIVSSLGSRPPELHYNWRSLWQTTDAEKADIGNKQAEMIKKLVDSGVMPAEMLTEAAVNMLTEAETFTGIEAAYVEWLAGGGQIEPIEEDPIDIVTDYQPMIDVTPTPEQQALEMLDRVIGRYEDT